MDSDMEAILKSLDLAHLTTAFDENGVGCREAIHLTDSEFQMLGVTKIGDRARIRLKCKEVISGEASTLPTVRHLRDMVRKSRSGRGHADESRSIKHSKETLRIYAGWKHLGRKCHKVAKQVLLSQGGGTQHVDIIRNASLKDVLAKLQNTFFPNGKNQSRQLLLKELKCKITKFSGNEVEELLPSGKTFTLERFFRENSRPVRLYLETTFIEQDLPDFTSSDSGEDVLPDVLHCERQIKQTPDPERTPRDSGVPQPDTPTVSFPKYTRNTSDESQASTSSSPNKPGCSYEAYVDILDDTDEDEEMALAIKASLNENSSTNPLRMDNTAHTSTQVVMNLASMVSDDEDPITVIVHRKHVLNSTIRTVTSDDFDFWRPIRVVFSGEDGEDEGGPRREFLKLLMRELVTKSGVFQTRNGKATFQYDLKRLNQNTYKVAGQLVLWSLSHGGPGLQALCPSVYSCMAGIGSVDLSDINSIPDLTVQMNMEKLKSSSKDDFRQVVTDLMEWLVDQGVGNLHSLTYADKEQLLRDLLKHQLYYRVQSCIMQFKEGLGALAEELQCFPKQLQSLFILDETPFTLHTFKGLYEVDFSSLGSNNRVLEEDTIYCWEVFLQNCTSNKSELKLTQVLEFWTGAEHPPPAGFDDKLQIAFYSIQSGCRRLPSSSTCGLVLNLPRGMEDPDELESMLIYAVKETQGFGKI